MKPLANPTNIAAAIVDLAAARGADKTICPSEVARHLGGQDEAAWRPLMDPIREQAIRLAEEGAIMIKQGGTPVDTKDLSGIYRIAIAKDTR
ncbi:DUF3253 domain-containing protein [Sulfitobacter litoralis]|uniref:DUF3253 domain-containing protein n=1 Tax=Sulfitobacter litoralis TaxID=335975 RepID=UPI002B267D09|nr:DUF3253 domain-containing protein [Sulfitobacter litoralis]